MKKTVLLIILPLLLFIGCEKPQREVVVAKGDDGTTKKVSPDYGQIDIDSVIVDTRNYDDEDTTIGKQSSDGSTWELQTQTIDSLDGGGDVTSDSIITWPEPGLNEGDHKIFKPLYKEKFELHQNFPNPFNPGTTLRYNLPSDALVTFSIYNMLGQEIKQLVNKPQKAGINSIPWDATDRFGKPVNAGLYFYNVQARDFKQTKKMVLLK